MSNRKRGNYEGLEALLIQRGREGVTTSEILRFGFARVGYAVTAMRRHGFRLHCEEKLFTTPPKNWYPGSQNTVVKYFIDNAAIQK